MTRTSPPQVAFSSGEIGPLLHHRFDYQRYQTGVARAAGFLPTVEGPLTRAPGTWYRGQARDNSEHIRLVPFVFADNDAVVLEFTNYTMRVWRYGALVTTGGGTPYQLATPYGVASLPRLRWVQSADVLYMVDGINPVQRLARSALNSWTITPQPYLRGPFGLENLDTGEMVQASAMTGVIALTSGNPLFTAAHVGALMRLRPSDLTNIPIWRREEDLRENPLNLWGWTGPGTWPDRTAPPPTQPVYRRYDGRVYRLTNGNNAGINPPIHESGEELTDNVTATKWQYVCDDTGIVQITAVANSTNATATVLRPLSPAVVDLPTWRWSFGAWSQDKGYPSSIELYDQRLVLAGTPSEPRTLWFSAIGDYSDFLDGVDADEAFTYTVAGTGNAIVNLFAARSGLHIFTLGEEFSTRSESRDQAIGPTTAVFGRDSAVGASAARPIAPYGDPIFITRDGRRVVEIAYNYEADANRPSELSRPSAHLGDPGFAEIVWQGAPMPVAWARRGDGSLCAMVYDPAEEVLGWAPLPIAGGTVLSMAVTPSADGTRDVVTLAVNREYNNTGSGLNYIEELAFPFAALSDPDPSLACHLFNATRFAVEGFGTTFNQITLPQMVGETISAWTSEGIIEGLTVPFSGVLTLPFPLTWGVFGLFDATHGIDTLDITAQANDGATLGRRKRLQDGGGIGLYRTAALKVEARERAALAPARSSARAADLVARPVGATGTDLFGGLVPLAPPSGQATEVAYRLTPVGGAPATLTAIIPFVQEAGR